MLLSLKLPYKKKKFIGIDARKTRNRQDQENEHTFCYLDSDMSTD